jgi:hypothetical protein
VTTDHERDHVSVRGLEIDERHAARCMRFVFGLHERVVDVARVLGDEFSAGGANADGERLHGVAAFSREPVARSVMLDISPRIVR